MPVYYYLWQLNCNLQVFVLSREWRGGGCRLLYTRFFPPQRLPKVNEEKNGMFLSVSSKAYDANWRNYYLVAAAASCAAWNLPSFLQTMRVWGQPACIRGHFSNNEKSVSRRRGFIFLSQTPNKLVINRHTNSIMGVHFVMRHFWMAKPSGRILANSAIYQRG